jgi:hypothetical protein
MYVFVISAHLITFQLNFESADRGCEWTAYQDSSNKM